MYMVRTYAAPDYGSVEGSSHFQSFCLFVFQLFHALVIKEVKTFTSLCDTLIAFVLVIILVIS